MSTTEVWILGGYGRTGRGIAAQMVARGTRPVLVGRDPARLAAAASATGASATIAAASVGAMAEEIARRRPAVVVNTVGPFTASAPPIVRACLAAGSDYLDLANDLAAVLAVMQRNDTAVASGRTLVTGAGFGVTATESVVVRLCEQRPSPVRVRVDMVPSLDLEAGLLGEALAGTLVEGLPGVPGGGRYAGRRYEGGRLVRARLAGWSTRLRLPDGSPVRTGLMPLGELVAAQRASGAPSVVAASSEAPGSLGARAVLPLAALLLGFPALRRFVRGRLARVRFQARERPRPHSWGHARLEWADGSALDGWLRLGEAQVVTDAVAAEVASRLVAGAGRPGAWTPAALFGSSLAEACGGEYLSGESDRTVGTR